MTSKEDERADGGARWQRRRESEKSSKGDQLSAADTEGGRGGANGPEEEMIK